jgi:hypothetical protein
MPIVAPIRNFVLHIFTNLWPANATGKIAFLGNIVAIYKDQIYEDGSYS